MKVSRELALRARIALDEWLPPRLRDAPWLMSPAFRVIFGKNAQTFLAFKDRAHSMTETEFSGLYAQVAESAALQGETDLNGRCIEAILHAVEGSDVLEVGCGRGHLAGLLSQHWSVTACDIVLPSDAPDGLERVVFEQASVEDLPFADSSFDTVVCTHTLEHLRHLVPAINELRRVARHRLIIVVPRERPYRYTFNLHLQFFPYRWTLESAFGGPGRRAQILDLGDWFYVEDMDAQAG